MTPSRLLYRAFRSAETRLHELNYLFWECTLRCNLHCRHCGSDCSVSSSVPDMPLEDFLGALDTIPREHRPRGFTIVLTGGEPLLRQDLEKVGIEFRKRGFGWGMVTNGKLYSSERHKRLMAAGMGALTISIDGLEDTHDWMRGCGGSFSRALDAARLAATEPRLNADIVTCVNQRNLTQLPQLYELISSTGIRRWRLFTVIPIGRAANDPLMILRQDQLRQLMDFIADKRRAGDAPTKVSFSCEGYVGAYESLVRDTPFFCRAGINIASVLSDGRICACPNVDRDRFSQGNIYSDNLYEVWNTKFEPFRRRDWTKTGRCGECLYWKDCQGGGMHNWYGTRTEPLCCNMLGK